MVSVLDRKLERDLRAATGMLLAIAGIIAVGVACFVAMRSCYQNLSDAKRRYYAQCRMADFSIELNKAPVSELAPIAELPGVVEIQPRLQFHVTVDLDGVVEPLNGLVLSLSEHRPRTGVINDIVLMRGGDFTDRRDDEVIVNDAFARQHGIHPGDWIHLLLNNRRQELFVVGTAISSEFVYLLGPGALVPDPKRFGVFYLKHRYMEEIFDFEGACNQVLGLMAPEVRERPDAVLDRAERLLEPFGVFATTPRAEQVSNRYVSDELDQLATYAVVMPAIFLAVAALVLNVLMKRLIEQQRTIIGTLKAIGYADGRLLAHYLKFGMGVGSVGGLLGCLAGYGLAALLTNLYRQFFEFPELENRVFASVYVVGLAISLVCSLLGAWRGARSVLQLEPAESMRPKPPPQGGAIALEQIGWLWSRLDTGWRMVLRNVFRNGRRSLVGVFASAMATSLLVTVFLFQEAVFDLVDFQFQKMMRSDLDLTFQEDRGYDAWLEARRLPGVDHAEPVLTVACTFRNGPHRKKAGITGLVPEARLTVPRDHHGRPVRVPDVGLVMGRQLARTLHLSAGDVVTIEPVKGRREPRQVQVVAIIDSYLGLDAYANLDSLSRLVDEEFAVSAVQLQIDPRPSRLRVLYRELKQLPSLEAVRSRHDVIANLMSTIVDASRGFTVFLILSAGVILFGTALNAALVGLSERQQEVATLLVLGYTPSAVGRLFLRENLLIHLVGTLLGLPLGYGLYRAVGAIHQTDLFRIPVVSPISAWAWTLVLSVGFTLLAHLVVQRSIRRTDWVERLKVRE